MTAHNNLFIVKNKWQLYGRSLCDRFGFDEEVIVD